MQEPMQNALGLPLGCSWAVGFGPILNKNQARKNQAGKIKTNIIISRKITPADKKIILILSPALNSKNLRLSKTERRQCSQACQLIAAQREEGSQRLYTEGSASASGAARGASPSRGGSSGGASRPPAGSRSQSCPSRTTNVAGAAGATSGASSTGAQSGS